MKTTRNLGFRAAALAAQLAIAVAGLATASRAQDSPPRKGFSIQLTSPKNNQVAFGKIPISATVKIDNPAAVERVEFLVGEKLVFVDREPPYEYLFDFGEEPKSWIVRAVAYHREGISVSDTVVTRKVILSFVEDVRRVVLWATFTDRDDNLVTAVSRADVRVTEEGKPQEILDFSEENRAITLAILLDCSGSMREQMKEVHAAAGSFVDTLRDQDRALLIAFDEKVFLLEDLTGDRDSLKKSIVSTEAIGSTAVYDAMHAAYRKLRGIGGRKAIVLLSDGDDTSSNLSYDRILEEAKLENIIVYAIGLGGGMFGSERKNILKDLSGATGGRAFFVDKAAELADVYARIADELRKQFFITYSTTNTVWDGRFIPVKVEVLGKSFNVRARKGYFAVKPREAGH